MRRILMPGLLGAICFCQSVQAQYYYSNSKYYESDVVFEMGLSSGIMNSLTDLGGKARAGKGFIKDLRWKPARFCYGAYITATYKDAISGRIEGTFGSVAGFDSILQNVASTTKDRYERNLSFRSRIAEVQVAVEVHPLFFKSYDEEPPRLSPYLVAGAGYFSFNPEAQLNGQWYYLAPLRLEGQGFREYPDRKPYKLSQLNILGGLGLRYEINSSFNARMEIVHRKLFTDYLDDVSTSYIDPALFYNYLTPSQAAIAQQLHFRRDELVPNDVQPMPGEQRGAKDKDAYFTIVAKVGVKLGRQRR